MKKFFLLLYGFGSGIKINLVGQLAFSEIFAFFLLPFINLTKLLKNHQLLSKMIIAYAILLLSLIFSDIFNGTLVNDYLRGWASVIFSIISIIFIVSQIDKNSNYCTFYLVGIFMTNILWENRVIDIELSFENSNFFKTRLVGVLNPAIILLAYYLCTRKKNKNGVLLMFTYSFICIIFGARSNALIILIASCLLWLKIYHIKIKTKIVIIALFPCYIFYCIYMNQVLYNNLGGENNNTKIQLQYMKNPYNPFELLYYGRLDVFIAVEAIKDNPVIGYGSWGKDPGGKYSSIQASILGLDKFQASDFIRGHSILLTAWLWGGICGFLGIIFLFLLIIKMGVLIYKKTINLPLLFIIMPLFIDALWTFLFSPFGALRTTFPIIASLLIVEYDKILKKSN